MFIRVRKIKSIRYYYLVENERVEGKYRQRVVEYLGNYNRAIAALEKIPIAAPSRQRLAARIQQIEAKLKSNHATKKTDWTGVLGVSGLMNSTESS